MILIVKRVLLFLVPFSFVFLYIHSQFESIIARPSTQSGLAGFYSVDGIIFGLIVAFVIQREWETWTQLSEAVRTEIDAVREMWKWSSYAEASLREKAHQHLENYITLIISEWNDSEEHSRSETIDAELDSLRDMLVNMPRNASTPYDPMQNAFVGLVDARNKRLNFSNEHMPHILMRIVILADILLVLLSLLIAVNDVYLDFLFTASISLLAFSLILVVDDLDNPFRPGTWHLTAKGYKTLLESLKK